MKYERMKKNEMSKAMREYLTAFTGSWDASTDLFTRQFKKEVESRLRNAGWASQDIRSAVDILSRNAEAELFGARSRIIRNPSLFK